MKNIIDAIDAKQTIENTYLADDGLLHCTKCHGYRQTKIHIFGNDKIVGCICDCMKQERDAIQKQFDKADIERKRQLCFGQMSMMKNWTFENDDNRNEQLQNIGKNYVKDFKDYRKDRTGLLLYGNVGTGKSYAAACIANALLEKGYKVKMATLSKLVDDASAKWGNRQRYLTTLSHHDLIVFDDLGTERSTEYMTEQVFNIVDAIYNAGVPFIVTTNLTNEELKNPDNIQLQRIYDRVLERCTPVKFDGQSKRREKLVANYKRLKDRLGL